MKNKFIQHEPHRLYILVRNDLPSMNPGRAMAQAAHAANQLVFEHGKDRRIVDWQEDRGFGTTICLSADKQTIYSIIKRAQKRKHLVGLVYDPTYKYAVDKEVADSINPSTFSAEPIAKDTGLVVLFRNELTCGYVFLHEDHPEKNELVGGLPLHP
jgi:peptidyl-tRNA hydrolase